MFTRNPCQLRQHHIQTRDFAPHPPPCKHTGSSGVPTSLHVFPSLQGKERTFPYTLFCTVSDLPRPLRVPQSRPCFATVFLAACWSFSVGPRNPSTHASGELRFVPGECGHAAACVSHGSCFCGPVLSHHGHVIEAMGKREEAHGFPHGRSYVFFRSFFVSVVSFVSSSTTPSSTASTVSTSVVSVISPLGSSSPSPGSRGCTCTCCLCIRRWTCTYVWPGRCVHLRFHRPRHRGGRPHALSPADGSLPSSFATCARVSQLHAHVCRPRDTFVERSATTRGMAGDPTDPPTNRTRRGRS